MNKEQKSKFVHEVFENIHTQYDKANNRISFGLQKNWKQELVDKIVKEIPKNADFFRCVLWHRGYFYLASRKKKRFEYCWNRFFFCNAK